MASADRDPLIIIGENVHATRSFARKGKNIVEANGVEAVAFKDAQTGADRTCPICEPVAASAEFAKNKVKHIRNALLLGMGGDHALDAKLTGTVTDEAAQAGKDYLVAAAIRQQRNGAHYLDVNVDEISPDEGVRIAAMEWLVGLLEGAVAVPLSLDSSSMPVLEVGFKVSKRPCGPLMLNSASAERPEALDLAAANGAAVVLSAAGIGGLPSTIAGRVENGTAIYRQALERGIAPANCHVDLLVLPVGVDSESGNNFIGAARQFRAEHGPEVRLTGGLSNVSFGLPNRKLINDAFLALAMDAGVDSGIVDPNVINPDKVRAMDRTGKAFKMAADVLTGVDMFAMEYLDAFRAGELGTE
jgi:5-methyltetrahydrofolate--homocysteine methyltransferase